MAELKHGRESLKKAQSRKSYDRSSGAYLYIKIEIITNTIINK